MKRRSFIKLSLAAAAAALTARADDLAGQEAMKQLCRDHGMELLGPPLKV